MIKNKRQLTITKSKLQKLRAEIESIKLDKDLSSIRKELILGSQIALKKRLENQIQAFEWLTSGEVTKLPSSPLSTLGSRLIEARIGKGMTQKDLANKLEMKEQQIQRYEKNEYGQISFDNIIDVTNALDISVRISEISLKKANIDLRQFPNQEQIGKVSDIVKERGQLLAIRS